ncbi:MAG: rod shape-determining protein MreD [Vicinamibacterales bacterium]
MKFAKVILGLVTALALQTMVAGLTFRGMSALDLVLIVVVYVALTSGPAAGLLAGSAAGLVQDALSSGVLGIGGLAKTIVGFAAGVFGTQFIVTASFPRFVVFVLATLLHAALFMGLYVLLGLRHFPDPYTAVLGQAFVNGIVGVVGSQLVETVPSSLQRRRAGKPLRR